MFRRLPLRSRLTLLTSAAVALAIAVSALACWWITRDQLHQQLDQSLRETGISKDLFSYAAQDCRSDSQVNAGGSPNRPQVPFGVNAQLVLRTGDRCVVPGSQAVTVDAADIAVAKGDSDRELHNSVIADGPRKGDRVRVLTTVAVARSDLGSPPERIAISVSRDLSEIQASLTELAWLLAAVAGLGVLGAASVGLVVARSALRPVDRLTRAVEHIARTEDLTTRLPVEGKDEIARLGTSFNAMTSALASSQERQQRLIADAGHELRTPLTSLRTNVDLLLRSDETGRPIPPEDRRRLLQSVRAQMGELSGLIGDLLELSRPDRSQDAGRRAVVAVHEVVEHAVERARLRGPGLTVTADVEPWFTVAHPAALERAVVNLLDNAVKFSPAAGTVEVRLSGGALTVRDHGPGIAAGELPFVFERFWRSPSARSMPGSGLGLSIVARAVEGAGGRVALAPAVGGGTMARVDLPGAPTPPPDLPPDVAPGAADDGPTPAS